MGARLWVRHRRGISGRGRKRLRSLRMWRIKHRRINAEEIESFNKRFPCRENSCAITHLDEAMMWLEKRTRDRENREVEGKNEA